MARNSQIFAAAATAAFFALGGIAFAMATSPNGGHPGGGPTGPGPSGPGPSGPGPASAGPASRWRLVAGCDVQADQMNLARSARRDFIWRCEQGNI